MMQSSAPLRRLRRTLIASALTLAGLVASARAEMALLMVEQAGCVYCQQWNAEISAIYPLTDEGRAAPLVTKTLHSEKARPQSSKQSSLKVLPKVSSLRYG